MDEIDERLELKRKMHEQKMNQKKEELQFLNQKLEEIQQEKSVPKTEDELLAEAQAALQEQKLKNKKY